MKLPFHTLDVFTDRRFGGNPLAVVHDAAALTGDQMQTIAREFNLSETVFVLPPENPSHSARVRIYTPTREMAFAGHPTIGTAILLAETKSRGENGDGDALVVLELGIGPVRVGVRMRRDVVTFAEFDAPKLPMQAGQLQPTEKLAAGLGLIPSEIGFENHRPSCFSASNAFAFVPVSTREALDRAHVHGAAWSAVFEDQGFVGAYLYTRQCVHNASAFHVRMFAPGSGIPEDPATGSAAVCFAGVIKELDDLPDGTHKRLIEQGYGMGRPSQIALTLVIESEKLTTVRIGGQAVRVAEGTIEV
ncbi:MAG: PhzF family phenazine biosynthesis protein [Hyphomicrobium sp.]